MNRIISLEPAWKMHAMQQQLLSFPPTGYEFLATPPPVEGLFKAISSMNMAYKLMRPLDNIVPTMLIKSWLQRRGELPANVVLTYAVDHLVFRREPWVVEVEYATMLAGIHPKHLKRFKGTIEKALGSHYCKRIFCWSRAGQNTLLSNLDPSSFRHKIEVVPYSVPPKPFVKKYGGERVKLLFIGSGTSRDPFEGRGSGVFEVFSLLRQQYSNLDLVVRCHVPPDVKSRYAGMANVKIIDHVVPWEEMEQEFQSADIFILPSFGTAPLTILDAMSYELPVVTIDTWANPEYVENGKTGLVSPKSEKLVNYCNDAFQPFFHTRRFQEVMHHPDPEMVTNLAKSVSLLIENPELRRRMGEAGRWEVENGKFSLKTMNDKLVRAFDEAIEETSQPVNPDGQNILAVEDATQLRKMSSGTQESLDG